MKKFLLPAALLLFSATAYAQSNRCGTADYLQQVVADHPERKQAMNQVEAYTDEVVRQHPNGYRTTQIVTIPVIFHVVYNTTAQNLSTARLLEQIQVLNEDFRKLNADASLVPAAWQSLAADCEIEFCLAKQTPSGQWTDGIERIQTSTTSFSMNDNVKHASSGGADAWDRNSYLNIWVCNISGGILGYATFPNSATADEDGVVLNYRYVGKTGASAPYNKGRTATHEIGHYFNLWHIWGDDGGSCSGSDLCGDTPNQGPENYGNPSFPHLDNCQTSGNGVMFMNYMDYTDDDGMYMFTAGQKTRMWAAINGFRSGYLTTTKCNVVSVSEITLKNMFSVYPSPSNGAFTLYFGMTSMDDFDVTAYNVLGEVVYGRHYDALTEGELYLDLTGEAQGVYIIEVSTARERVTRKLVIER